MLLVTIHHRLLHLFNTHLQSIATPAHLECRDLQLVEFVNFQTRCLKNSAKDDIVVVCGNFIVDAINEKRDAFRTSESLDYKRLAHLISCEHMFVDPFRKCADSTRTYQRAHPFVDIHPITFSARKVQRCVDYMFISGADESFQSTVLPLEKVSPHRCLLLRVVVPVPQPRFNLIRRPPVKPRAIVSCLGMLIAIPWMSFQSFLWFFWRWKQLYKNVT